MQPRLSRHFGKVAEACVLAALESPCVSTAARARAEEAGVLLNDVHARLSPTRVAALVRPRSLEELCAAVGSARERGLPLSICGGRHSMGGQPFAAGALQVDTTALARVIDFDAERGLIEVEAGLQWPELLAALRELQPGGRRWGIRQKQTGADRLTLGGAFSANVHGRGLRLAPFVADVESCLLVDSRGEPRAASREQDRELFRLATGGYGLFGPLHSLRLRLAPLRVLERIVELREADEVCQRLEERASAGCLWGDFQFSVDPLDPRFLRRGVLSCYRPVDASLPRGAPRRALERQDWKRLLALAHTDKRAAFERYAAHYLSTGGQLYDSDEMQAGFSVEGCHQELEAEGRLRPGSEMISELFLPRRLLSGFLSAAAGELRRLEADVIYGTVRLIERDDESLLAWARQPWSCVVLNLNVDHDPRRLARARAAFRALIDLAGERGGSYYLTYHRWARRDQVLACHPRLGEFLREKRRRDPEERFQSEWYRHHARLLA